MNQKFDVVLIGTEKNRYDYLGSRTFHVKSVLQKNFPDLKIGVYDVYAPDGERLVPHDCAKNILFLPWCETLDPGWCDFMMNVSGLCRKILYTDNFYWFQTQKNRLLHDGFNPENIFDYIFFSSREHSGWWNEREYCYLGTCIYNDLFKDIDFESKKRKEKTLFVDTPWTLDMAQEPFNAIRVLDECIPQIKIKYPELIVVSQNCDREWVDINLEKQIPLETMINDHYCAADAYIVSHKETCGIAQFEAKMCGTKLVTTKNFSNNSALLSGTFTQELWSFEEGNQSFVKAVENCLKDYDKEEVRFLSAQAYDDKIFADQLYKYLWNVNP